MCATMQTKIRNCCTGTYRVTARYNSSSVTTLIITTMNGSRVKITRIFVCKCQYLSVTFAKILIGIKIVEKHKTRKIQHTFHKGKLKKTNKSVIMIIAGRGWGGVCGWLSHSLRFFVSALNLVVWLYEAPKKLCYLFRSPNFILISIK